MKRLGKGQKLGKMAELVAHFREWTTGWGEKAGKGPETGGIVRASGPLWRVAHWLGRKGRERAGNMGKRQSQWPTLESGPLAGAKRAGKGRKHGKVVEPVAHSGEWTTSWDEKAWKGPEIGGSA